MAKAESVELLRLGESPTPRIDAITENVSARGARVITNSLCAAGDLVLLEAPKEHRTLSARVVYCQRLGESQFAVGLELAGHVEEWQKPAKP